MKIVNEKVGVVSEVVGEHLVCGHFENTYGVAYDDAISTGWVGKIPGEENSLCVASFTDHTQRRGRGSWSNKGMPYVNEMYTNIISTYK